MPMYPLLAKARWQVAELALDASPPQVEGLFVETLALTFRHEMGRPRRLAKYVEIEKYRNFRMTHRAKCLAK